MAKKVNEYKRDIEKALKNAGKYSRSLEAQIMSLAGTLRTIALANDELDSLESTTIPIINRYNQEAIAPHPVFKIMKDAQDSVTKQMKALSLTAEDLLGSDENDPLITLTDNVRAAQKKSKIIKPE